MRAKPNNWTVLTKDKVWVRTPRTDPKLISENAAFRLVLVIVRTLHTTKYWWYRLEWFHPDNSLSFIASRDYSGPIIRVRPPFTWANREIETFLAERRRQKRREEKILMPF